MGYVNFLEGNPLFISCLGFFPGFGPDIDPRRLRKILHWSTPKMHGSNSWGRIVKIPQQMPQRFRRNTWILIYILQEHWWNDIMKSLYKSFKCDSVIYNCRFFFDFPRIVGKLPKMNQQLIQLILGGATIWHDEMRVLRPWAAACECWKIRSWDSKEMDVSENRGTPKWMVKIMENPITMDDLGVPPHFRKHPNVFGNVKETCVALVLV